MPSVRVFAHTAELLCDVAKMPVVGEVNDLADQRHFAQQTKHFFGTGLVKSFHDVISYEGYGWSNFSELLIAGKTQCEIKLKLCSC